MYSQLVELINEKGLTVSTVESCTGGLFSHYFTKNPGASEYFLGGIVAYHKDIKVKFLNIDENIPLISKRCAEEMVAGLKKAIPADICISTTGLLQVEGVVYVSVLYNDIITTFHFTHNHHREADNSKFDRTLGGECIIQKTISHIIDIVRKR